MHQETAPDPYKLQYFSFGYHAPPEPSKQDAIWPLNNTGAFGIEPAFKQEEIDTMHQHLEQRSNGGQELLHLMVRTDDSVVMSQCMDKCSFSSTPSFAMDSTNSTQQLFLLDMSNEVSQPTEWRKPIEESECLREDIQDDCNLGERLDTIHRQNFSNHRPARPAYIPCDPWSTEDYSQKLGNFQKRKHEGQLSIEDHPPAEEFIDK